MNLVSKPNLKCFLLKSKENLITEQKSSVLWSMKRFYFYLGHPVSKDQDISI